jgi:hypothetical protein
MGETGNSYTILVAKPEGNLIAVKKKILKHFVEEEGIQVIKATIQWQVLVHTVVIFQDPYKKGNFSPAERLSASQKLSPMLLAMSQRTNLGSSKVSSQNEAAVNYYRQMAQSLLHSCLSNICANEIDCREV